MGGEEEEEGGRATDDGSARRVGVSRRCLGGVQDASAVRRRGVEVSGKCVELCAASVEEVSARLVEEDVAAALDGVQPAHAGANQDSEALRVEVLPAAIL